MLRCLLPFATFRLKALRRPPLDAHSRAAALSWLSHSAPRFAGGIKRSLATLVALQIAAIALTAPAALALAYFNYVRINHSAPDSLPELLEDALEHDPEPYIPVGLIALAILLIFAALSFLFWLRLGCLAALRRRAFCSRCQHDLTALPIRTDNTVQCPECANLVTPIAPWNEITPALSPAALATFRPNLTLAPRFWTRRRLKITGVSFASLLLLAALAFGVHWLYIDLDARRQAAQARAERLSPEEIAKRINEHRERPSERPVKAADLLKDIAASARQLATEFNAARGFDKTSANENGPIDVSEYHNPMGATEADRQARRKHAENLLLSMRASGLIDTLHTIPDADPWIEASYRPRDAAGSTPFIWPLTDTRSAARLALADMLYCNSINDDTGVDRAIRTLEALTNISDSGPYLIHRLVRNAIEGLLLTEYLRTVTQHPSELWLSRIEQSIRRLPRRAFAPVLECERLIILDAVTAHYSDPARIKRGEHDPEFNENSFGSWFSSDATIFGTFSQVRDSLNAQFGTMKSVADIPPHARTAVEPLDPSQHRFFLADFAAVINKALETEDRSRLKRQAIQTMVDLERFRLTHSRYPTADEFTSLFKHRDYAIDPYSGKLFGYRLSSSQGDSPESSYLLWSAGHDRTDNAGAYNPRQPDRALRSGSDGNDIPLNVLETW